MTRRRNQGSILIVVMFVMTVLALLAASFAYATSLRSRAVRDRAVMAQLRAQGRSAVAIAVSRLGSGEQEFDHLAQRWSLHPPLASETWLAEWAPAAGREQAEFVADYQVVDEAGKLNLSNAPDEALRKLGMSDDRIAALRDWFDADDIAQAGGAESEFYRALPEPYVCKNAPAEVLDELLLIRGFGVADFYGSHAAPLADLLGEKSGSPQPMRTLGWVDLLTTFGAGKINLNTAPRAVLETLPLSASAADQIVRFRDSAVSSNVADHAFKSEKDIEELQGLSPADKRVLKGIACFRSEYFTIFGYSLHRGTGLSCRIEVMVKRGKNGFEVVRWK